MANQKASRKPREKGVHQILLKASQTFAQAAEQLRREEHRGRKDEERVRILLQTYAGPVLQMLARVPIPDGDREFLIAKGYLPKPKKGTGDGHEA